jgi:uncharacterized RDD family membrane protein YckC
VPNAAPFIAPPWKRVIAGAVDGVLYLLLFIVAIAAVMSVVGDLWGPGLAAVAAATYVVYHVAFFLVLEDATPGLRALNMRIVSTTAGGSLSLAKMLVRSAFRPVMLSPSRGWSISCIRSLRPNRCSSPRSLSSSQ